MNLQLFSLLSICTTLCLSTVSAATVISFESVDRMTSFSPGTNWTVDSSSTSSLLVGDSSNNTGIFETVAKFDISDFSADIANATSITLEFVYDEKLGAGASVEALAFDSNTPTIGTSAGTALHNAGMAGTSAGTYSNSSFASGTTGGTATWDVTSIVKTSSLNTTDDLIGFLFTSNLTGNNANSTADAISFQRQSGAEGLAAGDLQLVIIPEPSTFAMLLLSGLGMLGLGRRRKA